MRVDAAQNREHILGVARELVAVRGAAVTMGDLAARSGLAVGTLYRHFPTKDDLVAAVVADLVDRIADSAEEALQRTEAGGSAWDELTAFWTSLAPGQHAGRSARLAAASLGIRLRDDVPRDGPAVGSAGRALTALGDLVDLTHRRGELRLDVGLADLFLLMAQAPEHDEPELRARYFALVTDGLRPPSADAGAGAQSSGALGDGGDGGAERPVRAPGW